MRLTSFLDWPRGVARLGVVACVAIATVVVVVEWLNALDELGAGATQNAEMTFEDRELGAVGNAIVADQRAMFEARALIPQDESYRVVVGPRPIAEANPDWTRQYIGNYATYFLMPRRPSDSARWVLCYGCVVERLAERVRVVWTNGAGIALVRILR
jgi:hypothetical protein